jgi:hypothetical protein
MENPYQPPANSADFVTDRAGTPFGDHIPAGKASHVPIVAILMMVQGGLEVLMALYMLVLGILMPVFVAGQGAGQPAPPQGPPPAMVGWAMGGFYLVIGASLLAGAVLKLIAGYRNYRFRGRILGFVALFSGLATLLTCICFPTALGLLIYGLIVYLDQQTIYAFQLGEQGKSPEQVKADLERYR